MKLKNKYRAQPVVTEEGRFASQREYQHWCMLKLRLRAGEIRELQRQVPYGFVLNGIIIAKYIADAAYFEGDRWVVADAKGFETPEFKIKRKMMKAFYNIDVVTV